MNQPKMIVTVCLEIGNLSNIHVWHKHVTQWTCVHRDSGPAHGEDGSVHRESGLLHGETPVHSVHTERIFMYTEKVIVYTERVAMYMKLKSICVCRIYGESVHIHKKSVCVHE